MPKRPQTFHVVGEDEGPDLFNVAPSRSASAFGVVGYELLTADSSMHVIGNVGMLTPRDALIRETLENLRQSAGINRTADIPLQSTIMEDKTLEIHAALSQASPVDSGRLAASWLNGESQVINNGDGTYTLDSRVPYARINDLGGDTGRDGKTHISPSYYVSSAEAAVGLEPGSLEWVDGRLSGAGGVGVRGFDIARNPLSGIALGRAA